LRRVSSVSEKEIEKAIEQDKLMGLFVGFGAVFEAFKFFPAKFTCFFECSECGFQVASAGTAAVSTQVGAFAESKIKVDFFSPTVPIFPLNSITPKTINDELLRAFNYFHSDLTAAGSKVRRATEQFCVELGYKDGSLHKRIEEMTNEYPVEVKWLRSLKWLGNEATHSSEIEEADLLHSFEIFAELLDIFRKKKRFEAVQQASLSLDQKFKKQK
jgi:hypothetical protein